MATLDSIDWNQPWLAPYRHCAAPLLESDDWLSELNRCASVAMLRNHRGLEIRFVPQHALPKGTPYESWISETGQIPTRDNLHDFFNGLMWLSYPAMKARLNQLQAEAIQRTKRADGNPKSGLARGPLRDAATIFDENAAIIVTTDVQFVEGLRRHRWLEMLWEQREQFHERCAVRLFGHALIEKLTSPWKSITAHAWIVMQAPEHLLEHQTKWLDDQLTATVFPGKESNRPAHLPVSGIPGWWPAQDKEFYLDASVFRPGRG